jgi:hypothetical protein
LPLEHVYRTVAQQWIIPSLFIAVGTSLVSRWLAMDFRSGSIILAFRCHFNTYLFICNLVIHIIYLLTRLLVAQIV